MSKLKTGDKVKVITEIDAMNGKVGDILTVAAVGDNTISCKEIIGMWSLDFFEPENVLKRGQFFKKDKEVYVVAESVNQRWLVCLSSGELKWLAPSNTNGSTLDLEGKGYKLVQVPKEVFNVMARVNE